MSARTDVIPWLLVLMAGSAAAGEDKPQDLQDLSRRFGEAVGVQVGMQVKQLGLDPAAVAEGVKKGLSGESKMTPEDMNKLGGELQRIHQAKQAEEGRKQNAGRDVEAKQWKAENKMPDSVQEEFYKAFIAIEGVKVTASGLAYQVLKMGEGAKPKATDSVQVHYTGRHTTGMIFDSSVERGEPATFEVGGVIRGWIEGLQLMPVGSKFRFTIPAELAYGQKPAGGRPPGVLVFDVELLSIVGGQAQGDEEIKVGP